MVQKSQLKFLFVYKLVLAVFFFSLTLHASDKKQTPYEYLNTRAEDLRKANSIRGWGYVISGGVALAVSIPGYYLSEDIFARTIYSLGQSVGVASVGYGSYLILVDDDIIRFHKIISTQASLTESQKNDLAKSFLQETAAQAKRTRHLRSLTHGLMAGLNFLNAATAEHRELRTALFFLGGVNTLVSLTNLFSTTDEEKVFQEKFSLSLGPTGFQIALKY